MSLRGLFGKRLDVLISPRWSGELALALQELYRIFTGTDPIELTDSPLLINNQTNGPAIIVNNQGEVNHWGIQVTDPQGRRTILGIGLGNEAIIANNVVPLNWMRLDPEQVARYYGYAGQSGGQTQVTPGASYDDRFQRKLGWPEATQLGAPPGPGITHTHRVQQEVGSGYTGVYGRPAPAVGGSTPHDVVDKYEGIPNGQWGDQIWRGTVNQVLADTLVLDVPGRAEQVTVARFPFLQQSTFDGVTRNGVTYTYTDAQTRTASKGGDQETQILVPRYEYGDTVYFRYIPNGTNVDGVRYLEINGDARGWATKANGC